MQTALLLAEPEPEARSYLERHLRTDGFEVIEAGWSAQALDLAERSRPDIVIAGETDLCRRLREGEPGRSWDRNVPVIVLTSDFTKDRIQQVRQAGGNAWIEKPPNLATVGSLVRSTIDAFRGVPSAQRR